MKIGVISDTHIPNRAKGLPKEIFTIFSDVDVILHAGDLVVDKVLFDLSVLAPVEAVAGNMDPVHLFSRLGGKRILNLGGKKIGLTHGSGPKDKVMETAQASFLEEDVDCIIFGHSHQPYNRYHKGILLFNPGSPTDKRREKYPSCGLLEIRDENIYSDIIHFQMKKPRFF